MRLVLPRLAPRLLILLLLGPLTGGIAEPTEVAVADRDAPVLWVHGIYPTVPAGMDYGGWERGLEGFAALGRDPDQMWVMGLYDCDQYSGDSAHYVDVAGYGPDPTAWTGAAHEATECTGHGHGHETPIEHLAWHWAWAAAAVLDGECGVVVAHSMGGLVVRHALMMVEAGAPDYPALCIEAVVTMGTPHGGTDWATLCPGQRFLACHQMHPDTRFMQRLEAHGQAPQAGTETRWLAIASEADAFVSVASQVDLDTDASVTYHWQERIGHTRLPTGNYIDHGFLTDLQYRDHSGAVTVSGAGPLVQADRFFTTGQLSS